MSSISQVFDRCRSQGRTALIPYFMAGYPSANAFGRLIETAFDSGADLVEIGIPFSDPVADGPTIQRAGQSSLEQGVHTSKVIELLRAVSLGPDQPLIIMSYFNPILQFGVDKFLGEAHGVGVRGLIIPDLVLEEGRHMERACRSADIDLIYLLAPTSPSERQKEIFRRSRGFVYAVSTPGVTGARRDLSDQSLSYVAGLQKVGRLPVAIGFGISSPESAARAAGVADGVVVGSALIDLMSSDTSQDEQTIRVADMISQMRASMDSRFRAPVKERQRP